jgi:pimeloyl-ACP methyl ester carboxylesterase
VVAHVLDTLTGDPRPPFDGSRIGAIALSLGGHYGLRVAAAEPRLRALVTVSGVAALPWADLPAIVTDTLAQRCGSEARAREFASTVDATATARQISIPLLVVAGGQDPIPRPDEAETVAHSAPNAQLLLVPDGDHLLANRQWLWLNQAGAWLADQLDPARTPER